MKILRVLPVNKTGGAESMARAETEHNCNHGTQDIIYLHSPNQCNGLRLLCGVLRLYNALRRDNYTVIVSSLWPVVPAVLICRIILWRRKYQWTHCIHSEIFFSKSDFVFTYLAIRFADGLLCDSSSAASLARRFHRSKPLEIVRPIMKIGAHPVPKIGGPSDCFSFITWGRINRGKNIDYGIKLIAELVAEGYDANLMIIGPDEDNLIPWLDKLSIGLKLSNRIKFVGQLHHDEIYKIASNYNYFIVASSHEGLCIALTEAMQLGLLPVVSLVGGIRDYCADGENCIEIDLLNLSFTAKRLIKLSVLDRSGIITSAINTFKDSDDYVPSYYNALKKLVQ
jgi:glycosyltransferase involved in cell wall biosynthesis